MGWVVSHESTQYRVLQVLENEQAKEMARKEKARLKLLEQQRKEQVEQMHAKLNSDAAAGEVCEWWCVLRHCKEYTLTYYDIVCRLRVERSAWTFCCSKQKCFSILLRQNH